MDGWIYRCINTWPGGWMEGQDRVRHQIDRETDRQIMDVPPQQAVKSIKQILELENECFIFVLKRAINQ